MTKKFKNINELLSDPRFIEWLCDPTVELDSYWEKQSDSDLTQKELISNAKAIFLGISIDKIHVSEPELTSELKKLNTTRQKHNKKAAPIYILKVAASILLVFAALSYFLLPTSSHSTDFGQTKHFTLKDGTSIVLNANSNIHLNSDDNAASKREVWIDGEAYFDVESDPNKPFTVHTSHGDVVVLGTEFNINDSEDEFSVYLQEGAIKFVPNEKFGAESIDLDVKKRLIFKESTKEFELETSNDPNIIAWKDHKIVCEGMSLSDLSKEIEAFYGVRIVLKENSLVDRKLDGTLENQSLEELLNIISETFDLNIKSTKSSIEFSYN